MFPALQFFWCDCNFFCAAAIFFTAATTFLCFVVMSSQNSSATAAPVVPSGTPTVANPQTKTVVHPVHVASGKNFAGRGKGSFGGKGGKGGKLGALRHAGSDKILTVGYSKPGMRRLCKRAGCKMVSSTAYAEIMRVVRKFANEYVMNSFCYADHAKRKTVIAIDGLAAGTRMGRPMYSVNSLR